MAVALSRKAQGREGEESRRADLLLQLQSFEPSELTTLGRSYASRLYMLSPDNAFLPTRCPTGQQFPDYILWPGLLLPTAAGKLNGTW
jgi:hypothetical protein